MLLMNRVFGSKHSCPPQLKEVMADILKKCHGLPLAIITIASLLASEERSRKRWESIRDSLRHQFDANPTLEEMKSILNLSYMHLPGRLRACFLYFDLEDVGRSYFNELINRSMIQPCKTTYGEVLSCRVHDIMLDFILSRCDRDNFISVAYNYEDMKRLHGNKYKVRRLSLRSMAGSEATYDPRIVLSLSQVRSFTLLGNSMPPILLFKYLRMFRINAPRGSLKRLDLTAISQLFQLRYLYISGPDFVQVPAELQGLVYLEMLDIHDVTMEEMLPEWIGNMKSLRCLIVWRNELTNQRKVNVMKVIMGLGGLTNLKELKIKVGFLERPELDALACSIGKLHNLKNLQIDGTTAEKYQLGSLSNPFQRIEHFHGKLWNFGRVPIWMGGLHCLRILNLCVVDTSTEEFHLLGELPSLVELHFSAQFIPKERAILSTGLFPVLEHFTFLSGEDVMAYLGFEAGVMPNLQTLNICFIKEWGGSIPVGVEHLLRLQKIHMFGPCSHDATVSAFRKVVSTNPNHPSVKYWY
ncbi:hypothetical protein ACQJBY_041657 [Aegilops geniculata]